MVWNQVNAGYLHEKRVVASREVSRPKYAYASWASIALLLLLFALLAFGARQLSMTLDEPSHIVAGYTLLARGHEGFWTFSQRGHPPLINLGEGLLLFLTQPDIPVENLDGWGEDYDSYTANWRSYLAPIERTEVLSRTPVMLLAVLLGAVVFRWVTDLGGAGAGLLALIVMVFDPLLLAHGRLATNDVGVTSLGTLALFVVWRWIKKPSWPKAFLMGMLLGLTMLAKASGALWMMAYVGMAVVATIGEPSRKMRAGQAAQALAAATCALFLLWGAYGFSVGQVQTLPVPLPAPEHWEQIVRHTRVATWRVFSAFGQLEYGRQWWYYPFNFLVRNPLPILAGLTVSALAVFKRSPGKSQWRTLGVFPIVYPLTAIIRGTTVGYRHMLPVHPFLYLLLGVGLWIWTRNGVRWKWAVIAALATWYAIETLLTFPNEITYFNQLVGGPQEGYRYLVDYTQDWGQSYKQLRTWLAKHPGPEPGVVYFTKVDPGFYDISFHAISPAAGAPPLNARYRPDPGRYVIGVTPLQGIVGPDRMILEWFRHATPTAKVGQTLFVYDVEPFEGSWLAQCNSPEEPLTNAAVQEGLGRTDLRRVAFDCSQSWIYPDGGQENGWYAFHGQNYKENGLRQRLLYDPPQPTHAFLARHLNTFRFSYQQERASLLPSFVLYEATLPPELPRAAEMWAAEAGTPPDRLVSNPPLTAPVSLNGPLDFLGIQVYGNAETLEVETWWKVQEGPVTRPISLMAHLVAADGQVLGVADGLGVSPVEWATGDILVQRHAFPKPPAGTEVWLRTGAYWLEDGVRWEITEVLEGDAIFLPLQLAGTGTHSGRPIHASPSRE